MVTQGHSAMDAYVTVFAVQVSETGAEWEEIRDPDTDYAKVIFYTRRCIVY